MLGPISRRAHGLTDYSYIPLVAASPYLVGFASQPTPTRLAWVLAGVILAASLFTRAEWGLFRVLPFKLHLVGDMGVGLIAAALPFLFGFADQPAARNTFLVAGAFGLLAGLMSRPEEMPSIPGGSGRRLHEAGGVASGS